MNLKWVHNCLSICHTAFGFVRLVLPNAKYVNSPTPFEFGLSPDTEHVCGHVSNSSGVIAIKWFFKVDLSPNRKGGRRSPRGHTTADHLTFELYLDQENPDWLVANPVIDVPRLILSAAALSQSSSRRKSKRWQCTRKEIFVDMGRTETLQYQRHEGR